VTPPTISTEDRNAALAKAAQARRDRATAKDAIRKGAITLADVLGDPASPLQRAYVRQVLQAIPGVGRVKAGRVMQEIDIDPNRRIQGLGERQRLELLERFSA
jgi:hypothetical protein